MHIALGFGMKAYASRMHDSDPHLILKIDTKQPIELGEFVSTFVGLGSQYERFHDAEHPEARGEARFYVREVRAGSIIAELIPYSPVAIPALGAMMAGVKNANDLIKFVDNVRDKLKPYFKRDGRTPEANKSELGDFLKTVQAVAHDEDGSLSLAVYENGQQRVEFDFTTREARRAEGNLLDHRRELESTTAADYQRVTLRFVRPSAEAGKPGRKGGERGIIDRISPYARPVMYASDMAEQRMKHELIEAEGNVFRLLFDVDVNVELSATGKPLAYRITAVHTVVDGDEDTLL
jgi:hypothetical protein